MEEVNGKKGRGQWEEWKRSVGRIGEIYGKIRRSPWEEWKRSIRRMEVVP
jgi:hypothetical protein